MDNSPQTLFEAKKLQGENGFSLQDVFVLELKHGLMGCFPAVIDSTDEPVACLDLEVLKRVWPLLRCREAKVTTIRALASAKHGLAFNLDSLSGDDVPPLKILTHEGFDDLTRQFEEPFRWAYGLVGGDLMPKDWTPFNEAVA